MLGGKPGPVRMPSPASAADTSACCTGVRRSSTLFSGASSAAASATSSRANARRCVRASCLACPKSSRPTVPSSRTRMLPGWQSCECVHKAHKGYRILMALPSSRTRLLSGWQSCEWDTQKTLHRHMPATHACLSSEACSHCLKQHPAPRSSQ